MRRADRKDSNDDNANRNPRSRQQEPASSHELKQLLMTARSQRDEARSKSEEWEKVAKANEAAASQLVHVQQELQIIRTEVHQWQGQAEANHQLFQVEQEQHHQVLSWYQAEQEKTQSYIALYTEEKTRADDLLVQFQQAQTQTQHYMTLYQEAQTQLTVERRSKAGIKGWETRRKRENERLKQEILQMTILVRESLAKRDETESTLYEMADRMDRIQSLVNSVEEESTSSPIGLLQKFKRIWQAVKEILED
ncbi:hypothetical protein [Leptolyngbya sp. 'hensonii']|uniref:hypothetical protein n=1 Tax=Leptolyngbya sp. 'hensonii' TaxID=1922337 RepID=UPI001C0C266D|nr:hypothetical protein [Leptolyngbya sp. 'hensonii']